MENVGLSLGSMIILVIVFYFVIKYAVRKAIVEAKIYEQEISKSVHTDKAFNEIARIVSGPYGLGTELFNDITKQQTEQLKPEYKMLVKRFSKLYLAYAYENTEPEFHEKITNLKNDFDSLIGKVASFERQQVN